MEAKKLALSIDTVKENLDLLRSENEKLVEENEELRQASLDGIEIAMAVQELTKEREHIVNEHILKKVANEQGYTMDQGARTVNTQHN